MSRGNLGARSAMVFPGGVGNGEHLFTELSRFMESVRKSQRRLPLFVVVCILFAAIRLASATAFACICQGPSKGDVFLPLGSVSVPRLLPHSIHDEYEMLKEFGSPFNSAEPLPDLQALDIQPDGDDGQARGDLSAKRRLRPTLWAVHNHPAEWRLCKPDTKFSNTFINSKSKPPPHKHPQTK